VSKYRLSFLFSLAWFLVAFSVGDYAELNMLMNGRSSANFLQETKNIRFTVPKGSVGKITDVKVFNSGNMGVEVELLSGKPGEKVWIYFSPGKKNLSFYNENPLDTKSAKEVKPISAKYTRVNSPSPAVKRVEKPEATVAAEGAAIKKGVEAVAQLNRSEKEGCVACRLSALGEARAQDCPQKMQTVGHVLISQDLSEGLCRVAVTPDKVLGEKWSRHYYFQSDGHFLSQDSGSVSGVYFFPRKNNVSYNLAEDGKTITIQTTSDVRVQFSTETAKVVNVTGVKSWSEKGSEHLKIEPVASNPILDLSFGNGYFPETKSNKKSVFKAGDGLSCSVVNSAVFDYKRSADRSLISVDFKYNKDADFLKQIQSNCH
jgi:hypothetical protein